MSREVSPPPLVLDRDTLRSGRLHHHLRRQRSGLRLWSDAEIRRSLEATLRCRPEGYPGSSDVWLFAYGSLLWNPTIRYAEQRLAHLHGYHRRFCLRTVLGRGSPERPGLMLALDRGGSCRGVIYRIPAGLVRDELELVWKREMIAGSYRPRWLTVRSRDLRLVALAFVIDRQHERYCGALSDAERIAMLATGHGILGPASDYLRETVRQLRRLGIPDRNLERLAAAVEAYRARPSVHEDRR